VRQPAAALVVATLLLGTALTGCGDSSEGTQPGAGDGDAVQVVAAENFWGDVARQIGGEHAEVTSIIDDPNIDPHLYESDPEDAAAVADADLVIVNGLELDEPVERLLSSTSAPGRKDLSVADVLGAREDANPHLWYDLPRVPDVARAIAAELTQLDPAHAQAYEANRAAFERSFEPALALVGDIKHSFAGAPVAYTERVAESLLLAAGLKLRAPPGFALAAEEGDEPSAADLTEMNELLDERAVDVLVYNAQATSTATDDARERAEDAGVPVVAVTETLPPDEPDFQTWQLHQLAELRDALSTARSDNA
jgi:zinc/manganese transport system substrate-binding protein